VTPSVTAPDAIQTLVTPLELGVETNNSAML